MRGVGFGHSFQGTANHNADGLGAERPREEIMRLPVLTVKQPWANLIIHGGKTVENRTWAPPSELVGWRIGIHAGMSCDRRGLEAWPEHASPRGMIIGTVELIAYGDCYHPDLELADRELFIGPCGWILRNPRPMEAALYCKGRQGIWYYDVPARLAR